MVQTSLLLANLLARLARQFSQNVSQQEYSRLFATDRLGLSSFTEARVMANIANCFSHFGTYKDFSYSLDLTTSVMKAFARITN